MNLYPCAYSMTFNVTKNKETGKLVLNGILNQRSQDILTANNWNVCQYAVLLHMFAQVSDMEVGELVHVIADAHIYDKHKVNYHSNGVGVYNVQKRLKLYYGDDYGITYESEKGKGTTATITIPGRQEGQL